MEKVSSDDEHIARMRGLSHSKSSLKRSTTSSPIRKTYSRSRVSPSPSVDGAKTSEFKSFKRLLEKTTHKHCFDKVAKTDIKLKKGKARNCMEASSNVIPIKSDIRSSSLHAQNLSSIVQGFLSSSPTLVSQKQEFKNKAEGNNGAARSLSLSKITTVDQLFHPSPLIIGKSCGGHSGPMQEDKGTFSGKRAYLLQLAAMTRLQNVDDLLSNRSDFILEILQRMGIRRNTNKNEKLQIPEQKLSAHQILASSKRRSNHVVEFCDDSQENSCAYGTKQYDNLLSLKWDDTKIQALPYNHSLKACFESKHRKSDLVTEKTATLLYDFYKPASAIELIKEFDCNKCDGYTGKAHPLLNSPCDTSDSGTNIGKLYKNLYFNPELDHKELFDLNSKLEDCSSLRRNPDSFQADCIFPNSCDAENFLEGQLTFPLLEWDATAEQEQPVLKCLVPKELDQFTESAYGTFQADCIFPNSCDAENFFKGQLTFPLLEWDATAEQEQPALKCLVPKELDQFTESVYDTFDFSNEIGSSSFFDVYERESSSFLTEL